VRILGFDTATAATTVAILDTGTGEAVEGRDDPGPGQRPRHTTRLMVLVDDQMRALGVGWGEIDRIAVGVGPGTFTGLRIGVATAQALARAREIALVGVSTLHSLARGAAEAAEAAEAADSAGGAEAILAVIDARRGEAFAAGWSAAAAVDPAGEPLLTPRAVAPDTLAGELVRLGHTWLAVGDGAIEFREALERVGARIPEEDSERNRVSAVEICRLAAGLAPEPPDGVRPEYLRLPDAEISRRAARQR
jgi:tRNA threonylcarbamoyladenosine biosynthesis protein TsaB